MIGSGGDCIWKMVALVDLSCASRDRVVENALSLAARLHADLSLVSAVPRRAYERGVRYEWPQCAFGKTCPEIDVHRVVLPGEPAAALARYADQIRADVLVVPAEYEIRGWFRNSPLVASVAGLTSRALWIAPPNPLWTVDSSLRVGCVVRLDGTDDLACTAAVSVLRRCGGELVLTYAIELRPGRARAVRTVMDQDTALQAMTHLGRSLDVPWSQLVVESCSDASLSAAAVENNFGLIVTGRPMYVKRDAGSGHLVSAGNRLPCPVLSIPFSSVSTPACVAAAKSTAIA